jgi:GAF domain-containing protein
LDDEARQHADEFAQIAVSLHEADSLAGAVDRVLEYAVEALGADYAGVILVHEGRRVETVAATSSIVADLDAVQMECGQGPDLEILADRPSVTVPDVTAEQRWPEWAQKVAATGVRSMLGTRLSTASSLIGSLNVYGLEPGQFGPEDVDVAQLLARHASVAIDSARESENLWRAIDARNLIGQAQGILMERFGLDADQAFAVLRRYSQDHNLKLHVVAQRLIDTRSLEDDRST